MNTKQNFHTPEGLNQPEEDGKLDIKPLHPKLLLPQTRTGPSTSIDSGNDN